MVRKCPYSASLIETYVVPEVFLSLLAEHGQTGMELHLMGKADSRTFYA